MIDKATKATLVHALIENFEQEHDHLMSAARATYETATHEENRAENKYDTRSLLASYLAESQSKQVLEIRKTINIYRRLPPRSFGCDDEIALSALVEMSDGPNSRYFFIGPCGGGATVHLDDLTITVITRASPIGKSLIGRYVGDSIDIGSTEKWVIASIS